MEKMYNWEYIYRGDIYRMENGKGVLEEKNIDVRLFIDTAQFNTNSPQAHKKIMQMLEQQVGTETEVNWYAYGLAELNSNKDFHLKS